MKRRTKRVLGLSIGIPIILVVAVLIVLRLSSANPELDLASIEIKDVPDVWVQAPSIPNEDTDGSVEPDGELKPIDADAEDIEEPDEAASLSPAIDDFELPISGTLVLMDGDKPFGEESFELVLEDEEIMLRSNGKFWFKALIATITLKYDQILQMDSRLRPMSLASTFEAPLGFGRTIQAEFTDGTAIVRSGEDVEETSVDLERAYVLGTFSTYVVIPLLYELRQFEGEVGLETLVFGGPPNRDDDTATDGLPETRISRIEDTIIRFSDRELAVSQYQISGDMGTMILYARGIEMLGLFAGDEVESMFVYRADYFEDGFEIVENRL